MKTLKKIFSVADYIKRQSYAYQHQGQHDRSKGDRSHVPTLKRGMIALRNSQNDLIQSWLKPVGFQIKKKK